MKWYYSPAYAGWFCDKDPSAKDDLAYLADFERFLYSGENLDPMVDYFKHKQWLICHCETCEKGDRVRLMLDPNQYLGRSYE